MALPELSIFKLMLNFSEKVPKKSPVQVSKAPLSWRPARSCPSPRVRSLAGGYLEGGAVGPGTATRTTRAQALPQTAWQRHGRSSNRAPGAAPGAGGDGAPRERRTDRAGSHAPAQDAALSAAVASGKGADEAGRRRRRPARDRLGRRAAPPPKPCPASSPLCLGL